MRRVVRFGMVYPAGSTTWRSNVSADERCRLSIGKSMHRLEGINASWAFARPLPLCFHSWRVGGCIKKTLCSPSGEVLPKRLREGIKVGFLPRKPTLIQVGSNYGRDDTARRGLKRWGAVEVWSGCCGSRLCVLGWRWRGFVGILWLRAALLGGENSAGCSLRSGGCNNYCGAGVWRRLVMSRHR